MAKILYVANNFHTTSRTVIDRANLILEEYAAQGFDLTLRQLYYQFVARGFIANSQREYKNLGAIINDARLAGLVDWDHIIDRTRNIRGNSHWANPAEIISSAHHGFRIDKWASQRYRIEVWVEKDALIGVIGGLCQQLDVPFFSCRGYTSQSEVHEAAKDRLRPYAEAGYKVRILHLGDHDPSGIDMTRDIGERLAIFKAKVDVKRIALNMEQVKQYNPPPNPVKLTDIRSTDYIKKFGDKSWELDALDPKVLNKLITSEIQRVLQRTSWKRAVAVENEMRLELQKCSNHWPAVSKFLKRRPLEPKKKAVKTSKRP